MEKEINNNTELRASVTLLTSNVNKMCNAAKTEDVIQSFVKAKDLLLAIYKYKIKETEVKK